MLSPRPPLNAQFLFLLEHQKPFLDLSGFSNIKSTILVFAVAYTVAMVHPIFSSYCTQFVLIKKKKKNLKTLAEDKMQRDLPGSERLNRDYVDSFL